MNKSTFSIYLRRLKRDGFISKTDFNQYRITSKGRERLYELGKSKKTRRKLGPPYPYIFKPPTPPEDIAPVGQAQAKHDLPEEILSEEPYCKNCGSIISEGQTVCHVCKKNII